jgi:hypothetical protein
LTTLDANRNKKLGLRRQDVIGSEWLSGSATMARTNAAMFLFP